MPATNENLLGAYLKDRRARLDPAALGLPLTRRRTPGLRREEVAQRANVSATWYTWLEQGRGGAPSAEVLDRIARALLLTDVEREHLFLLALGRPPEMAYQAVESVSPRIQRVLDALIYSPAFVRTATWDLLAWNRAAAVVLNFDTLKQRNMLRHFFSDPGVRDMNTDWESSARFIVSAFRVDAARAGATQNVKALVEDLCRQSPEFAAMWRAHDVHMPEGTAKTLRHPVAGLIEIEYSALAVDGQPYLNLSVLNPATPADADRIRALIGAQSVRAAGKTTLEV